MRWPFKKKEEGPPINPKVGERNHKTNPQWYAKQKYEERHVEGDWCVIDDQDFEGVTNNLTLLPFMETKGWMFVNMWVVHSPDFGWAAEYIFRRIK